MNRVCTILTKALRIAGLATIAVAALVMPSSLNAGPSDVASSTLTLPDALDRAFRNSPVLRIGEARVAEARGRLTGAEILLPFNPELEGGVGQRAGEATKTIDWQAGLSQEIEIFGQRGDRIDVAESGLAAAHSRLLRAKRLLSAHVQLAFADSVRARKLVEIERTNVELATELLGAAEQRIAAGSATRLDVNLASAELGHAQRGFFLANAEFLVTRAILAETIGMRPNSLPEPDGDFVTPQEEVPPLSSLLESAAERRADLAAVRRAVQTANARIALARSEAYPNITLRGAFEREAESETIIGGGISLPIPLFARNQGGISQATAASSRAEAEANELQLQVEQEVVSTHARFEAARASAEALRQRVMGTLEENLELLSKSFKAGKVDFTDVLVIRRNLLESRAEYVEALASAQKAHVELLLAAGKTAAPDFVPNEESQDE